MNKRLYFTIVALLGLCVVSCTKTTQIDEAWKIANENAFNNLDASYTDVLSESGAGSIKWKDTNAITGVAHSLGTPDNNIYPYYTDTVTVRYTGWYVDNTGKQIIFDSTEGENNQVPVTMVVGNTVDGFQTALQHMQVGDEKEVWIPWQLGYGANGSQTIPGYTTLRFYIKLLRIGHLQ